MKFSTLALTKVFHYLQQPFVSQSSPSNDLTVTLPSHSDSHPDILAVGITAGDCLESGNSSLTKCDFYITLS